MKCLLGILLIPVLLVGCASSDGIRYVASDPQYTDSAYRSYFENQNFLSRVQKLAVVAKQLQSTMPEKGNSKKRLVAQFSRDVEAELLHLKELSGEAVAGPPSWLPATHSVRFNEKIMALGNIAQSYKVMSRLGIYLTASGIFEKDKSEEDFYLTLLDRATDSLEKELSGLMLIYTPEARQASETMAKMKYARGLTNEIRNSLHKVLPDRSPSYSGLSEYLRRVSGAADLAELHRLLKTTQAQALRTSFQDRHVMSSSEIDGFDDDVDVTLATKFSFEMLEQLAGVR